MACCNLDSTKLSELKLRAVLALVPELGSAVEAGFWVAAHYL